MSQTTDKSPVLDAFESVVARSLADAADERAVGVNLVIDIRRKRTEANMITSPAWMLDGTKARTQGVTRCSSLSVGRGPSSLTAGFGRKVGPL